MGKPTVEAMEPSLSHSGRARGNVLEAIGLGAVITLAFLAVGWWLFDETWRLFPGSMRTQQWRHWYDELLGVSFGLLLTLGCWRRSGLRIGNIRGHWKKVLLVCSVPIALTALVYPNLTDRPFANYGMGMWLTDPLGQELVFTGYLYGRFEQLVPGRVHKRLPISWALVMTAVFFSLMHLSHLGSTPTGYVYFMLCYTFLGMLLGGLARQWTGSILYGLVTHMAVNCIAWAAN